MAPETDRFATPDAEQAERRRTESLRSTAFGEVYGPTLVDRFGVWLSARQIDRHVRDWRGKRVADVGCGFHATFMRTLLDQVESAVLIDVSISTQLQRHPKVTVLEGAIPDLIGDLPSLSLDVILCISVLEHLWDPLTALAEFRRLLAPGGVCMINVPSWRGKRFLEYSAFRLGLSPAEEMNDHKCYFDVKDLWPLLVRAGFKPADIRCFPHKYGLNTFAVCVAHK
jgi:2-polyprenyl-3-methyl-5-hydroxy-6-metoxy-1,4-benzoquinol methylase